jgi:HK97 family phage major capsid protein
MKKEELEALVRDIAGPVIQEQFSESIRKAQEAALGNRPSGIADTETRQFSGNRVGRGKSLDELSTDERSLLAARCVRYHLASRGDQDNALRSAKANKDELIVEAWERAMGDHYLKALNTDALSTGGALVPPEFASGIIELLRAKTAVRALGATVMPMNSGSLTMTFQDTASSSAYVGAQGDNIVASQPSVGQLHLHDKKLATLVPISNDVLRNGGPAADRLVRDDMVQSQSLKEDITFIRSDGTSGEPRGMKDWASTTYAANGTVNLANVTIDASRAIRELEDLDVPLVRAGWIMNPTTKWGLANARDGNGKYVWREEILDGRFLGYPYASTTQLPSNLGSGSDESELYFADFYSLIIAENESIMVDAMPGASYHNGSAVVSGFSRDETAFRAISLHDFGARQRGKEIAVVTGVKWASIT